MIQDTCRAGSNCRFDPYPESGHYWALYYIGNSWKVINSLNYPLCYHFHLMLGNQNISVEMGQYMGCSSSFRCLGESLKSSNMRARIFRWFRANREYLWHFLHLMIGNNSNDHRGRLCSWVPGEWGHQYLGWVGAIKKKTHFLCSPMGF